MRLVSGTGESSPPTRPNAAQGPAQATALLLGRVTALKSEIELLIERMDEIEERFADLAALNSYTEESFAYRLDQSRHYGPLE